MWEMQFKTTIEMSLTPVKMAIIFLSDIGKEIEN